MHRIDTEGNTTGQFSDGNPQTGQPGTLIDAAYWQDLQETICYVIESAGIGLVKGDHSQLLSALAQGFARLSGATFTGNLAIQKSAPLLQLRSTANGRYTNLVLQDDGNLVFYMNTGGANAGLFNCNSITGPFNFGPPITRAGNIVWDAANDGSGSGLDADLLDGLQATDFVRSSNPAITGTFNLGASSCYMQADNTRMLLNFDASDYVNYDRVNDVFSLVVGGQTRISAPLVGHFYLTSTTGNVLINGNQIWHSANDGAGSGLDADLLDGQDSSYYTNIPARLTYTPANAAGQAFTGDIAVQKAGTANFTLNRLGVGTANFAMQDDGNFVLYRDGAVVFAQTSKTAQIQFTVPLSVSGSAVWNAGNDGAGSGLDADLLDGIDSSAFARRSETVGYGQGTQNMTGFRALGQNFTNDTGKPMFVTVNVTFPSAGSNVWVMYVDGIEVGYNSGNPSTNTTGQLCALVPAGSTYSANVATGNAQLHSWIEVR